MKKLIVIAVIGIAILAIGYFVFYLPTIQPNSAAWRNERKTCILEKVPVDRYEQIMADPSALLNDEEAKVFNDCSAF